MYLRPVQKVKKILSHTRHLAYLAEIKKVYQRN